jgi:HEAT repeat protein
VHESPIVRGYMAGHVGYASPGEGWSLYPLLADKTAIETQSGCIAGETTVSSRAIAALVSPAEDERVLNGREPTQLSPQTLDELAVVAEDDRLAGEVRGEAIAALAKAGQPEAHRLALGAVAAEDVRLREGGLRALAFLTITEEDLGRVVPLTHDADASMREGAANVLGHVSSPTSCSALAPLLDDPESSVRWAAAGAYAAQPTADVPTLQKLAANREIGSTIVDALRKVRGDVAALGVLEPVLMKADSAPQLWSVKLTPENTPDLLPVLRRLVTSPALLRVALVAADLLGRARDTSSEPAIARLLDAPDPFLRKRAVEALENLCDPRAIARLTAALRDADPEVRRSAAHALRALQARSAIPALKAAAKREDARTVTGPGLVKTYESVIRDLERLPPGSP